MAKRRRRRSFGSCSLSGTPEEDALLIERLRAIDAQAATEKAAIAVQLAASRRDRGKEYGSRLMRCAKVIAPAMPDNVSVCFRFKNKSAELYIPDDGRGTTRVAQRPEEISEKAAKKRLYAQDFANGMSQPDIAKKHGVKPQTVWAALYGGRK